MASFSALRTIANIKLFPGSNFAAPIVNQSITGIAGQITLRVAQFQVGTVAKYFSYANNGAGNGMAVVVNDLANPQAINISFPCTILGGNVYTVTAQASQYTPYVSNLLGNGTVLVGTVALSATVGSVTNVFAFYW